MCARKYIPTFHHFNWISAKYTELYCLCRIIKHSYTMYATAYIYTIVDIIHVHCTLYTWILYILKFYLQPFLKVLFMQTYYTYIYYILPVLSYSFTKGVWPFFVIYIWLCMLGCIYCLCMVIKVQYPHLHTFTRMVVFYTCQECTLTICTHSICIFKTMYTVHDIYHSTQSIMNIYVSMICIHAILSTSVL